MQEISSQVFHWPIYKVDWKENHTFISFANPFCSLCLSYRKMYFFNHADRKFAPPKKNLQPVCFMGVLWIAANILGRTCPLMPKVVLLLRKLCGYKSQTPLSFLQCFSSDYGDGSVGYSSFSFCFDLIGLSASSSAQVPFHLKPQRQRQKKRQCIAMTRQSHLPLLLSSGLLCFFLFFSTLSHLPLFLSSGSSSLKTTKTKTKTKKRRFLDALASLRSKLRLSDWVIKLRLLR